MTTQTAKISQNLHLWAPAQRLYRRLKSQLKRWHHALHYGSGHLTPDQAQQMMMELEAYAGWYPLLTLTEKDSLALARSTFLDHPEIEVLVVDACIAVQHKWDDPFDELRMAQNLVMEKIEDYARDAGKPLTRIDATAHDDMMLVRFHPQAWVNDHAVETDAEGQTDFYVERRSDRSNDDTSQNDAYAQHKNAPQWVRDWRGPFFIEMIND